MIDKILIERKLRNIEEFLKELEAAPVTNFEEFKANVVTRRFIERNIELAIEQMVDICKHLVSGLDLKEPETYAECFESLAGSNIIRAESVAQFQAMVRFRNMLIHIYDGIDDSITYGIYTKHLGDFRLFITQLREFIKGTHDQ
jgi:uncharacterized protein YutE (UPF0331/DUF86 family)